MNENTAPKITEEIPHPPTAIDNVPAEDPRDAHIRQLEQDMDLLRQENQQLRCYKEQQRQQLCRQSRHIKTLEISNEKILKEADAEIARVKAEAAKPVSTTFPWIMITVFAVLSLLVGLCADRGWMIVLLAEILICLFLCVCSFFGGIVWSRTKK